MAFYLIIASLLVIPLFGYEHRDHLKKCPLLQGVEFDLCSQRDQPHYERKRVTANSIAERMDFTPTLALICVA